jgi:hypothetical protein
MAANIYAPYATPKLAMIYAKNPYELIDSLGLTRADNGPNVLIASTDYKIFFEQPTIIDGTKYVSPVLAALDLLTSPGRGPTEGEELLNWMEVNQSGWKRKPNS